MSKLLMSSRHGKCQPIQEHVALCWGLSRPCWKEDEFNGIKKSVVCNKAHLHQTLNGGGEIGKILLQFARSLEVDLSFFLNSVVIPLGSGEKKKLQSRSVERVLELCDVQQKKPLWQFFLFLAFVSRRLSPFPPLSFLDTGKLKCFRESDLKVRWSVCNLMKKEKKIVASLFFCGVPLGRSASAAERHAPTANVIPTSPRLCVASFSKKTASTVSTGDVETPSLSWPRGEIRNTATSPQSNENPIMSHLSTPANSVTRANRIRPN